MSWIKNLRMFMTAVNSQLNRKADRLTTEKMLKAKADKSELAKYAYKSVVNNKVDANVVAREWDSEESYSIGDVVYRKGKLYRDYINLPAGSEWDDKDWNEIRLVPDYINRISDEKTHRENDVNKIISLVGGVIYSANWPSDVVKGRCYLVSRPSISSGALKLYKCTSSHSGYLYDYNYFLYLENVTISEAFGMIEADDVSYDSSKVYTAGNVGYEIQNMRTSLIKRGSVVVRSYEFNTGTMVAIYANSTTLDFTDQDTVMIFASTDTTGDSHIGFYCDDVRSSMGRYWISVGARNNVTRDVTFNFVIIKGIPGKPVIAGY